MRRSGFARHHVLIEFRWPAHGLAGVVDDEIQAMLRRQQVPAEGFDAGCVAKVQAENFQAMTVALTAAYAVTCVEPCSMKAGGGGEPAESVRTS